MTAETTLTVVGNLEDDPELRYAPSGQAVVRFVVLSTPRTFDRAHNAWRDGQTLKLVVKQWGEPGENVAESIHKGDRVVVRGELQVREWVDASGAPRTTVELKASDVAASMHFAQLRVRRVPPRHKTGATNAEEARHTGGDEYRPPGTYEGNAIDHAPAAVPGAPDYQGG